MRVHVNRKAFAAALKAAGSAVPMKSPSPILQGVLMRAADGSVQLVGTDNEIMVVRTLASVEVEHPGVCWLPAEHCAAVVNAATDESIEIEAEDRMVRIVGLTSDHEFPTEDPARFPAERGFDADHYWCVSAPDVKKLISRTAWAVNPDATRYAISGVLFEPMGTTMRATGLHGSFGARQEVDCSSEGSPVRPSETISIPPAALKVVASHLDDLDEPVHMAFTDRAAAFRAGSVVVWSRLVEGRFPRFDSTVPDEFHHRVEVDAEALGAAIRQAGLAAVDHGLTRRVNFRFGQSTLELTSSGAIRGRSRATVPIRMEGDSIEVGFEPQRWISALKAIGSGAVVIEIAGRFANAVVRADESRFLFAVAPVGEPKADDD